MDATPELLAFCRIHEELRQTWQVKALMGSNGHLRMCVLSVLSHNFDEGEAIPTLMMVAGQWPLKAPFLCTAARVLKSGQVVADVVKGGRVVKWAKLFANEKAMESEFRHLADRLKLNDQDRTELFAAVKRWVVCDYRIDPNMNPMDPDAKRLVVH